MVHFKTRTPMLSRESAVSLAGELHDVVVRLRIMEAKYGLEEDAGGETPALGARLLAALRPHAEDPEVAAHALRAGLKLAPLSPDGTDAPAGTGPDLSTADALAGATPDLSRHISREESAELPTAPDLLAGGPDAESAAQDALDWTGPDFSKQVSQGSSELSTAWCSRAGGLGSRSVTQETQDPARGLLVVPSHGPGHGQFVEHRCGASVLQLRRALAVSMQLPLGKVRLMAAAGGEAVTLGDHERAERATMLFVCGVAASSRASGAKASGMPAFTLEKAAAMQQDFLESFVAGQPVSRALLKEVQSSVLLRHGLKPSPAGLTAMLHTFDHYACNAHIRRRGEAINQRLGLPPQVFDLKVSEAIVHS
mmetsp:Transcript_101164/g.315278  ORF Transcript_101164/g.315278 Transcript_101164/m.315278 type:complete len:367 (+) Transcript_101164:20-1120(+)